MDKAGGMEINQLVRNVCGRHDEGLNYQGDSKDEDARQFGEIAEKSRKSR